MSVYIYRIKLLEPAIISSRPIRTGYSISKQWIPGLSVRGAILTSLLIEGEKKFVEEEERNPSLRVSPAYPVLKKGSKELSKSLPAHFYMLYAKREKEVLEPVDWIRKVENARSRDEILEPIKDFKYRSPAIGKLVAYKAERDGGKIRVYEQVKLNTGTSVSVAINKFFRRSEYGMVFSYESISEDSEFWGIAVDPEDKIKEYGLEREVWIGRATSRGFGHAYIKFTKVYEFEEFLLNLSSINTCILYALSPIAFINRDLRKVSYLLKKVSIRYINGKPLILGSKDIFISWFRRTTNEYGLRPSFEVITPGTIYILDEKPTTEFYRWLYTEDIGQLIGLNFLVPLTPSLLRGGDKPW